MATTEKKKIGGGTKPRSIHFSSKTSEWSTPEDLFRRLDKEFHFTVDVAASKGNAKCKKFYTEENDGLAQSWENERVFCNPPYGYGINAWIEKLASGEAEVAVGLVPARTDTRWFHDHILGKAEVRFIKGRLMFGGQEHPAPFPSMVAIWRKPQSLELKGMEQEKKK